MLFVSKARSSPSLRLASEPCRDTFTHCWGAVLTQESGSQLRTGRQRLWWPLLPRGELQTSGEPGTWTRGGPVPLHGLWTLRLCHTYLRHPHGAMCRQHSPDFWPPCYPHSYSLSLFHFHCGFRPLLPGRVSVSAASRSGWTAGTEWWLHSSYIRL